MSRSIKSLSQEIATIENADWVVATNQGTYSASEALAAVGTSDPHFADYREIVRVGGGPVQKIGCNESKAPGRIIRGDSSKLQAERERLAKLRDELTKAKTRASQLRGQLESLAKGWSGFQKVTAEKAAAEKIVVENELASLIA